MTTRSATPSGHLLGSSHHPVVVVQRDFDATTDEVWNAWTDPARLVRWLGAVEAPLTTPGRPVRLAMAADELPDDLSTAQNPATFTVLDAEPPANGGAARLVFSLPAAKADEVLPVLDRAAALIRQVSA